MNHESRNLSAQLGGIHHIIMRNIESRMPPLIELSITPPQIRTILFLSHHSREHPDTPICQRNLEEAFDLKPSSVSLLLRNMEKNGFIYRQTVEGDGRLKSVHLTDSAVILSHQLQIGFDEIEETLSHGITEEERAIFFVVLQKIRRNLE